MGLVRSIRISNILASHIDLLRCNFKWFVSHGVSIFYLNLDVLLLALFMKESDFAIYQILVRFFLALTLIGLTVNPILAKAFQSKIPEGDKERWRFFVFEMTPYCGLFFGISIALYAISPFFVIPMFNLKPEDFSPSITILLSSFFLLRVVANFHDVAFAALNSSEGKLFSVLGSAAVLALAIIVVRPSELIAALWTLMFSALLAVVIKSFALEYSVRTRKDLW